MMRIHLSPPLIQAVQAIFIGTYSQDARVEAEQRFEDGFTKLILHKNPFTFLTLTEEESQAIKVIFGERSNLQEASLKVVKQLKRVLIIPSDILLTSNESYNHYLFYFIIFISNYIIFGKLS